MLISKKDLLKETGISYGQLYRWKREGLIPDEWFQKQSSYTGQETFFEAEKILERVETIQRLKSDHSLEEIREIISRSPYQEGIDSYKIRNLQEICEEAYRLYEKESYTYFELVFLYILTDLYRKYQIEESVLAAFSDAVKHFFSESAKQEQKMVVYCCEKKIYAAVVSAKAQMELDLRLKKISEYVIDDIIYMLKKKIA